MAAAKTWPAGCGVVLTVMVRGDVSRCAIQTGAACAAATGVDTNGANAMGAGGINDGATGDGTLLAAAALDGAPAVSGAIGAAAGPIDTTASGVVNAGSAGDGAAALDVAIDSGATVSAEGMGKWGCSSAAILIAGWGAGNGLAEATGSGAKAGGETAWASRPACARNGCVATTPLRGKPRDWMITSGVAARVRSARKVRGVLMTVSAVPAVSGLAETGTADCVSVAPPPGVAGDSGAALTRAENPNSGFAIDTGRWAEDGGATVSTAVDAAGVRSPALSVEETGAIVGATSGDTKSATEVGGTSCASCSAA